MTKSLATAVLGGEGVAEQSATTVPLVQTLRGTVWIDLDNSPHVPFFAPIIGELRSRGCVVTLTARECFQVSELAKLFHLECEVIGTHHGKNRILKVLGTVLRGFRLWWRFLGNKPDIAVSHGSRAQMLGAKLLGVPCMMISDYEHSAALGFIHPMWSVTPEVVTNNRHAKYRLSYPGIKEDVYVPSFKPDAGIRPALGIGEDELLVTIRPPATEAHYYNKKSSELFDAVIEYIDAEPNSRIVMLPRNAAQGDEIRAQWPKLFESRKIMIPEHAVDGLNLIWHSDLVISGGGTMNREAAALGVPVYSIFRGKTGAVDRYLESKQRLTMVEDAEQVRSKIKLIRRDLKGTPKIENSGALQVLLNHIYAGLKVSTKGA